jgi:hypothetical protein
MNYGWIAKFKVEVVVNHLKPQQEENGLMENMINDEECPYYDDCDAPLCPLRTREENLQHHWHVGDEICQLEGEMPRWVQQQRKIQHKAKRKNRHSIFKLLMLEAPLEIDRRVKGLTDLDEDICWNCHMRRWFEKNRLPIPIEIEHGC